MKYKPNLHNGEQGPTSMHDQAELVQLVEQLMQKYSPMPKIIESIYKHAGKVYLVGGAVRDLILGLPVHDLDIEVHNLSIQHLQDILSAFGIVSVVGKSFGVLKLHGMPADWALPRTDKAGRKPEVSIDPMMDIKEALRRRDLTMNAMAIELHSYTLVDPFNGIKDIKTKTLRSPDIRFFSEDPLRFYRVMQFIGRFVMYPDDELQQACKTMDISNLSIERIEDEFEKLVLKSKCPSIGLRWLFTVNRLRFILPELADTQGIKQDPEWHPEGDVYEHLMQAVDAAALIECTTSDEKLILCYTALCHDLGKVSTTIFKKGRLRSPGHAEAGVLLTKALLKRITRKNKIIDTAAILVKHHMQPGQFIQLHSTLAAYRRLALKLAGYTTIDMLGKLCLADHRGRNGAGHEPLCTYPHFIKAFLKRAEEAQVLIAPEKQILLGRDIADLVTAGAEMGKLLKYAYELQLEEGIKDKEGLRKRIIQKIKSEKAKK